MSDELPIAFIGERLSAAQTDIRHDYNLIKIEGSRRGLILIDGQEVPFVIVTMPEQLRGIRIRSYEFLASSKNMRGRDAMEIEQIAMSRIYPPPAAQAIRALKSPKPPIL